VATKQVLLVFEIYESSKLVEKIEQKSFAGIINRDNVHRLLGQTGFEVRAEFGSYEFKKPKEDDELLIVEAVKKEG